MVRDGVTGCVVPARDPAAFAAAVVSLLADPARCAQFGSAARFDAQRRFALAAHTQATLEAYAAVIERCRSEGRTPGRVRN
jgi:glycosyltransferase involved in cell wall biosynthesis